MYQIKDRTGRMLEIGCPVVAQSKEGHISEGNVYDIFDYGCEWIDEKWTRGTVVILNHENGHREHWNPDNCDLLDGALMTSEQMQRHVAVD